MVSAARIFVMCGIAGLLDTRLDAHVDSNVISRMVDAITHRGPDDSGIYNGGQLALGTRRLKIIDLDGGRHMLPRNHKALICTDTVAECVVNHHWLEMACQGQVAALAAS